MTPYFLVKIFVSS